MNSSLTTDQDSDIKFLCQFIKKRTGIALTHDNFHFLESRLHNLFNKYQAKDLSSLISRLRLLPEDDLVNDIIEKIVVHTTSFFRGTRIFEDLQNCLAINYHSNPSDMQTIRVWSAATSTGEEAYSMAMLLEERPLLLKKCDYWIYATDISSQSIATARQGLFPEHTVTSSVPSQWVQKFFIKQSNQLLCVHPNIKHHLVFEQHNLVIPLQTSNMFHMILCRNVLIYFDDQTKQTVLKNLYDRLTPHGFLVLGGTEILQGMGHLFHAVTGVAGVYRKKK